MLSALKGGTLHLPATCQYQLALPTHTPMHLFNIQSFKWPKPSEETLALLRSRLVSAHNNVSMSLVA